MKYGKIVDGILTSAPIEIFTEDGRVIELNTREDYLNNGYKVIINKKPKYDKNEYDLCVVEFLETEFTITVCYELRKKEISVDFLELITIYKEEINK